MTAATKTETAAVAAVEQFLCPGCVHGPDPAECEEFTLDDHTEWGFSCRGWAAGTHFGLPHPSTRRALGLPVGFNKIAAVEGQESYDRVRLFVDGDKPAFDDFNVPVWALVEDGWLFIRVYMPRRGYGYVVVVEGGTLDDAGQARDIASLREAMD